MISTGGNETMGGFPSAYAGGFGGAGGLGGVGLVGLIGLNSFLGGRGGLGGVDGTTGNVVADQNVSELRKDVQGVATTVMGLGNELQSAIFNQTMAQMAQFTNVNDNIMNASKENALLAKDAVIAGLVNTQVIKEQAGAIQAANLENFSEIKQLINADGDATRALINQNLIDGLREDLGRERRGRDAREIEINISNSNQQSQNQIQNLTNQLAVSLNSLGDQIARNTNSVIAVGSTISGTSQAANPVNIK